MLCFLKKFFFYAATYAKIGFQVLLNQFYICPDNNKMLIEISTFLSVWAN